jgi:hypothetical protein
MQLNIWAEPVLLSKSYNCDSSSKKALNNNDREGSSRLGVLLGLLSLSLVDMLHVTGEELGS